MRPESMRSLPVTQFSLTPATTLEPSDSIAKGIGRVRESNLHEVLVDEGDRTAIVTLRDILNAKNITTTRISHVMKYVPRLGVTSTVGDAASIMFEYRIRSLPVYESGELKGVISSEEIVRRVMQTENPERINNLMTANPVCVGPADEVSKARRIMLRRKIDQLPILNDGRGLAGIITSSAIVFNMLPSADRTAMGNRRGPRFDVPVENFAEPEVVSNDVRDSLNDVFRNMSSARSEYSVVTNFDEVQGIITYRDFMRLLMNSKRREYIPMYIIGLPEDPFEAEATREKFTRVVSLLRKGYPEITEARAIIKHGKTKAAKSRYQVQIFVKSPRRHYSYQGFGFELPEVFDEVTNWAKRQVARYDNRRRRVRADPGSLA